MSQRFWLLSLLLAQGPACSRPSEQAPLIWWTTHSLTKVRPYDRPQENKTAFLTAARNEFEPFQIVFRTEREKLEGIDVQISDLLGPAGAQIPARQAVIYLVRYLEIKRRSSIEGRTGPWPDALIPRLDRYAQERRQAFPFDLMRGRNQPVWIEIYVPRRTPPGHYAGKVQISIQGQPYTFVPVEIKVWPFELPSTSSLPTSFGLSGLTALKQHLGGYTSDADLYALTHLYAKAALWHRISIHGGSMTPPPFSPTGDGFEVDWSWYDAEVGPFLDGQVFSEEEPLYGARATSIDLRTHAALDTDDKKILYWRAWSRHFREKGWFDRLFYYVWDEPAEAQLPAVAQLARVARRADPELKILVTAPLHPSLLGLIDIWCPVLNCFESKPGVPYCILSPVPRQAYQPQIRQGARVWWYQACGSHGCNIEGGAYFTGWPSYVIDVRATAHRIMEWVTWKYRIHGELYYAVNEAYSREIDPWTDLYMHGGNGDGTLFYPGRPEQIGGRTHIPIESIRLKLIREGLEDYEYFVLLSRMGALDFVEAQVNRIVQNNYSWNPDPQALYAARQRLAEKLAELKGLRMGYFRAGL